MSAIEYRLSVGGGRIRKIWAWVEDKWFPKLYTICIEAPVTIIMRNEEKLLEHDGVQLFSFVNSKRLFIEFPDGYKIVKDDEYA